ncbi:MAG: polymerase sigma factor RpoE [Candidatus Krumholzibacteriota bacterium]|jgi:RNA polymerase sigma-70 factor (ECF subfamily)|nr:polymerase sigma factor RpoE [Candidatus Krumholzibacteriota bacterium]
MHMEAQGHDDSDSRLVEETRAGSERAFREIVERHHAIVFAVVRGILGDRSDVEDVMQEVFIKVYKGLGGFRGDAKLSSWIYQIARNEALNKARKPLATETSLDDVVIESPEESRPDAEYRRKIEREHLERCLAELHDDFRTALELRYMGEMSYEEIAETMGLPIGTVKTYIHRGKIELRRVMSRRRFMDSYGEGDRS